MGASDWILSLPTRNSWTGYYLPKLLMLNDIRQTWYYKLPFFPTSDEGLPERSPQMNERVYLCYDSVIKGYIRNMGAFEAKTGGFPAIGESIQQGNGPYVRLVGPFIDIAFVTTDGRSIESEVEGIPKNFAGLRRFRF